MTEVQRDKLSELIKLLEEIIEKLKKSGQPCANWEKVLQEVISCMGNNVKDEDAEVFNALISLIWELIERIRKLEAFIQRPKPTEQKKKTEKSKNPTIKQKPRGKSH